jgi:hypothetical protein
MRRLTASELLDVWERGAPQPPAQQVLTLLAAANPGTLPEPLWELSIGQRDARLLLLREWTFGAQLMGLATCPKCGVCLEMSFTTRDIRLHDRSLKEENEETLGVFSLIVAEYEVSFRLPNSLDLAATADQEDLAAARARLLQRCLLAVRHNGVEITSSQLPAPIVEAISERMAQADPQADVQLALTCPTCGYQWGATFDIASFFWSEIDAWAPRILSEVHTLARAYGWREADILAMSPRRRQLYLEMVCG